MKSFDGRVFALSQRVKTGMAFAFCGASLWFAWLGSSQRRNIRAAQAFAPVIIRALAPYPEFKDVRSGAATGAGGILVVESSVADTEQSTRLKCLVLATNPPVKVRFIIRISPPKKVNAKVNDIAAEPQGK